jgi:hypothetical protein
VAEEEEEEEEEKEETIEQWRCQLLFNQANGLDDEFDHVDLCSFLKPLPKQERNKSYPRSNYMFPDWFNGLNLKSQLAVELRLQPLHVVTILWCKTLIQFRETRIVHMWFNSHATAELSNM